MIKDHGGEPDRAVGAPAEPDRAVGAPAGSDRPPHAVAGRDHPVVAGPDALTALAVRAARGDAGAAAGFVAASQDQVWRFVAGLAGRDMADDLTQEAYLRAFRALPGFAARSSALTWLLAFARRACVDHLRATARHARLRRRLAALAADRPDGGGDSTVVIDLLGRLPEERRVAFALTQLVGLSYAEAAEVEGIPVGTIRSRVARARADLVSMVDGASPALPGDPPRRHQATRPHLAPPVP